MRKFLFFTFCCYLTLILIIISCKKEHSDPTKKVEESNFEKFYGGSEDDYARDLIMSNENLLLLATTHNKGDLNGDYLIMKLDTDGTVLEEYTFGSDQAEVAYRLKACNDGGMIICGTTTYQSAGSTDIHLLKLNSSMEQDWELTLGGPDIEWPDGIEELDNGDFLLLGTTHSVDYPRDIYVAGISSEGKLNWERHYGDTSSEGSAAMTRLPNNNFMALCFTNGFGASSNDMLILELNEAGDTLWTQRMGSDSYEESRAIITTNDGHLLLGGHTAGIDPMHQMIALKLTTKGDTIWKKEFGGEAHDGCQAVTETGNGTFALLGRTNSHGANDQNTLLIETNQQGELINETVYGGSDDDRCDAIITHKGYYYIAGYTTSFGNGKKDIYLIKQKAL